MQKLLLTCPQVGKNIISNDIHEKINMRSMMEDTYARINRLSFWKFKTRKGYGECKELSIRLARKGILVSNCKRIMKFKNLVNDYLPYTKELYEKRDN